MVCKSDSSAQLTSQCEEGESQQGGNLKSSRLWQAIQEWLADQQAQKRLSGVVPIGGAMRYQRQMLARAITTMTSPLPSCTSEKNN